MAAGFELLVGARRDPRFGPLVAVAAGGIHAETLRDVAVALAPVDEAGAEELVRSLASAPLLLGSSRPTTARRGRGRARGGGPLDASRPHTRRLAEVEVNPLLVRRAGTVGLDARIVLAMKHDVIVVGGGFAGVTAAREVALRGRSVLLLEARDRLGGRTWSADWDGVPIEYGGAWVHWHQPHTWSEITRAGLRVELSEDAQRAHWWVGDERRDGTIAERDAIAERGWNRFVDGVYEALPNPHDPSLALDELARFDRLSIAERLDELELDEEERAVLEAELESLASGPLAEVGAVSVLRTHALSGYSLALAQYTGGRVTLADGTGALLARSPRPRRSRPCSRRRWRPCAHAATGSRSRRAPEASTRRRP